MGDRSLATEPAFDMVWRLLSEGDQGAAWNMAVDQAILEAVGEGLAPATLRLYGWDETAVTVGRFQNVSRDVHAEYCAAHGIPIVRRPTGGRGILHGADLTLSLALPNSQIDSATSVSGIYDRLTSGFVKAFEEIGLPLARGTCERPSRRGGDCFQVHSAADLIGTDGLKLVGSAMRRTQSAVLLQSSIRYQPPEVSVASVFAGAIEQPHFPLEHVADGDLRQALLRGFAEALSISLRPGALILWEEERAAALLKSVQVAENRRGGGHVAVSA